jgi:hypothetical protein
MEQDNPIELKGEQQHIVSLENYREEKSESITLSNNSAVVSQQTEVDEEESENKLYEEIKAFVIKSQQVSPALLQRKFKISYMKAARLIEKLEQNQVVSSYAGNGPRKVLISNDNGIPILIRESDINTTHSSDTNIKNTISQEVAIPGEDKEAAQEETSFFKDILYDDVLAFIKEAGTAPISVVQDKFNISYTRASRLIDTLQRNGEMPVAEEIPIESISPEITDTVTKEDIEEVIDIELSHMEECHEINMEVAELNKELSITMLEQEWDNDSIIHSEIPDETEPFHQNLPADELPITITGEAETHVEINTIPVTETVNHTEENKLDEEVAKVYESISITVHQNLEKNMVENTEGNEEQHEYKRMSYKERQERLKAQQKNKNRTMQSLLNQNEQPKQKTSNVMSKALDDFFD